MRQVVLFLLVHHKALSFIVTYNALLSLIQINIVYMYFFLLLRDVHQLSITSALTKGQGLKISRLGATLSEAPARSRIIIEFVSQLRRRGDRTFDAARYPRTRGGCRECYILAKLFRRRNTVSLRRFIQQPESCGADSGIRHGSEYTALHHQKFVGTILW